MISKLEQLFSDFISYINSLESVEKLKEYYETLEEREKKLLKLSFVVFVAFIVYFIFSSISGVLQDKRVRLEELNTAYIELSSLNKLMIEKGKLNLKIKDYVSLTALIEECESDAIFAETARVDLRESSKDIQRGKFKEYRIWAKYSALTLAQVVKFLSCIEVPARPVKITKFKLSKNLENNKLLDIELEANYRLKGKGK